MAEVPDNDAVAHQLDVLRASGAAERDPVRFAYLTALACRAGTQAEPIRQALNAKISRLADELAAGSTPAPTESAEPSASPLADLLAYINQHAHAQSDATPGKNETAAVNREIRPNLKSASARQTPSGPSSDPSPTTATSGPDSAPSNSSPKRWLRRRKTPAR
jgi:hypothetical protein